MWLKPVSCGCDCMSNGTDLPPPTFRHTHTCSRRHTHAYTHTNIRPNRVGVRRRGAAVHRMWLQRRGRRRRRWGSWGWTCSPAARSLGSRELVPRHKVVAVNVLGGEKGLVDCVPTRGKEALHLCMATRKQTGDNKRMTRGSEPAITRRQGDAGKRETKKECRRGTSVRGKHQHSRQVATMQHSQESRRPRKAPPGARA
jgi:hypothetical protein